MGCTAKYIGGWDAVTSATLPNAGYRYAFGLPRASCSSGFTDVEGGGSSVPSLHDARCVPAETFTGGCTAGLAGVGTLARPLPFRTKTDIGDRPFARNLYGLF